MRKWLLCILTVWMLAPLQAQVQLSESAKVYLITCSPGKEAWSKYGHTAILVADASAQIDWVFNYGIFDFNTDNFYLKFALGDTWYQLGIESLLSFVSANSAIGRETYWQELNLTPSQQQQLLDALLLNYEPENRYYHYNFVFDNCATRPYHLIAKVLGDTLSSTWQGYAGQPFRQTISHYTGKDCWLDFAINMVFGSRADAPMTNIDRLFLPEELMFYVSQATLADGTPLVKNEHIDHFEGNTVPWWKTCWLGFGILLAVVLGIAFIDKKRGKHSWWVDIIMWIVFLVLGVVVILITCFSCHPLVGFNWRLLVLPLIYLISRLVYWIK